MKKVFIYCVCFVFISAAQSQDSSSTQSYWLGKTTGNIPHLEYGLGDDRLGGAKMTYLDTNVVLKIIDSVGENYKVQLSQLHTAYISKSFVVKDSLATLKLYYLTDKWKVFGDSANDYVSIRVSDKLPYRTIQQINPTRIIVDIFGVQSNTNWITQLNTAKEIKNAWYEQIENDVMRVCIELKHPQIWGYHVTYDTAGLLIAVKRQKDAITSRNFTVAIDAGHGGSNVGAAGVTNKMAEKIFTLDYAYELKSLLENNGFHVMMTRTKDTAIEMTDRVLMLRDSNPDVLLSLHFNSDDIDTVSGVSTYYRYIGFKPLTNYIYNRMLDLGLKEYGNTGSFNFGLCGPTEFPNCLIEIAFLSNMDDEKKITDPKFKKKVAQQIYLGLKDWLTANSIKLPDKN